MSYLVFFSRRQVFESKFCKTELSLVLHFSFWCQDREKMVSNICFSQYICLSISFNSSKSCSTSASKHMIFSHEEIYWKMVVKMQNEHHNLLSTKSNYYTPKQNTSTVTASRMPLCKVLINSPFSAHCHYLI
jgi:hypothetical protein